MPETYEATEVVHLLSLPRITGTVLDGIFSMRLPSMAFSSLKPLPNAVVYLSLAYP